MKKIIIIFFSVGILLITVGGYGFFSPVIQGSKAYSSPIITSNETAINSVMHVIVDKYGNTYFSSATSGCIQVYDKEGNFSYNVMFGTKGGVFEFNVEEDTIKCYIYRAEGYFEVKNKEISNARSMKNSEGRKLTKATDKQESEFFDSDRKRYVVSAGKVKVYEGNTLLRTIKTRSNYFSVFQSWLIFAVGVLFIIAGVAAIILKYIRKK